jgi:hypothetical protein
VVGRLLGADDRARVDPAGVVEACREVDRRPGLGERHGVGVEADHVLRVR